MAAQKKLKTPTIHTRGGQFTTNTPSGVAAATVLDEIEKEFPGVQTGRSFKHDLLSNDGKVLRQMNANYANFQLESIRLSAEKSRAKTKLKAEATKNLLEIRDVLGDEEVLRILTEG